MTFEKLAHHLNSLEKTSSRIEITKILAGLFKKADISEIDKITYLLLGRLAPNYKDIVFNIAEKMMLRIISDAYDVRSEEVVDVYKKKGDLGNVAQSVAKGKGKNLSAGKVYDDLLKIANDEGAGSQDRKVKDTAKLLSSLDPLSARYVARIPVGKLRLGFSNKTIIDALSWMKNGDKSESSKLEKAYFVYPDVGHLVKKVKQKGIGGAVKDVKPQTGVPVLPMLAQRLKSPSEMIEKMHEVSVEPKFDGLRIQIHYKKTGFDGNKKDNVRAYTRNLNETSWMFPELQMLGKQLDVTEMILDTEAVGVDEERQKMANFQTTMTRRRKYEIEKIAGKIGIKFYVFDILLKNGKSLMNKTYLERRAELEKSVGRIVKGGAKVLEVVGYTVTKDPKVIEKEMRRELSKGLEGIIVKRADSKYVAGRTGWRWVKMKEEEAAKAKLADTVDCIVMGYSVGKGKRATFGVGQFLVGVRDNEKIKTVTKVGTGLTDDQFKELAVRLKRLEVSRKPKDYIVDKLLIPDFWVEPELVVEIAADEITKSPTHSSGYALRFPRLVKFRDDKGVEESTTLSELKKLFKLQNAYGK